MCRWTEEVRLKPTVGLPRLRYFLGVFNVSVQASTPKTYGRSPTTKIFLTGFNVSVQASTRHGTISPADYCQKMA